MTACGEEGGAPCGLQSSLPAYTPDCETAGAATYPDETRLVVGGTGGYLTVSLPPDVQAGTVYGGTTGEPLLAVLTLGSGAELLAEGRTSTVRVARADGDELEAGLSLEFAGGEITGAVTAPLLR